MADGVMPTLSGIDHFITIMSQPSTPDATRTRNRWSVSIRFSFPLAYGSI